MEGKNLQLKGGNQMNIEILQAFAEKPLYKGELVWSLTVRLIDENIILRGITLIEREKNYRTCMPFKTGVDTITKQSVSYLLFTYTDRVKTRELVRLIRDEGRAFIERLESNPSTQTQDTGELCTVEEVSQPASCEKSLPGPDKAVSESDQSNDDKPPKTKAKDMSSFAKPFVDPTKSKVPSFRRSQ
jgi:hypothetical protein